MSYDNIQELSNGICDYYYIWHNYRNNTINVGSDPNMTGGNTTSEEGDGGEDDERC
jgi:hypothetical protein